MGLLHTVRIAFTRVSLFLFLASEGLDAEGGSVGNAFQKLNKHRARRTGKTDEDEGRGHALRGSLPPHPFSSSLHTIGLSLCSLKGCGQPTHGAPSGSPPSVPGRQQRWLNLPPSTCCEIRDQATERLDTGSGHTVRKGEAGLKARQLPKFLHGGGLTTEEALKRV